MVTLGHGANSEYMRLWDYKRRAVLALGSVEDDPRYWRWVINLSTGECVASDKNVRVVVEVDEYVSSERRTL